MSLDSAIIVDGRMARPRTLAAIVNKPRALIAQHGGARRVIWLISSWQQPELNEALANSESTGNEVLCVSDPQGDSRNKIVQLLQQLESELPPGAHVIVTSYDREVVEFANRWTGRVNVTGLPMVQFREAVPRPRFLTNGYGDQRFVPETSLVEKALRELEQYLARNGVTSVENCIQITDIIPAVRIKMPELKNAVTTGLASAVIRLGTQRGTLHSNGRMVWSAVMPFTPVSDTGPDVALDRENEMPAANDAVTGALPTVTTKVSADVKAGNADVVESVEISTKQQAPDWGEILKLLGQWVSPKANDAMCRLLDGLLKPDGTLAAGEMTQYEFNKRLERDLRAENVVQFHDAEAKIAQKFCNRLMGSGSLLDSARKVIHPDDKGAAIAGVDRGFRELLEEWTIQCVTRGEPGGQGRAFSRTPGVFNALAHIHYGNGGPQATKRMEAAVDRLLTKRVLMEGADNRLHYRWPTRIAGGDAPTPPS